MADYFTQPVHALNPQTGEVTVLSPEQANQYANQMKDYYGYVPMTTMPAGTTQVGTIAVPATAAPAYAQPAYAQPTYAQPTYAQPAYSVAPVSNILSAYRSVLPTYTSLLSSLYRR